jgi:SpoVK/Ycf46/Vps4 family AAA+-type ATPase
MDRVSDKWLAANRDHLMARLADVRLVLERHAGGPPESAGGVDQSPERPDESSGIEFALSPPPAFETLSGIFRLSSFERMLLLMCAGVELDGSFASLCAAAQGDSARSYPTFGLALAAFPDAHWSAMSPAGPLRRWHMINVDKGAGLTNSALRIDERVLNYLTGVQHLDERLVGYMEPVQADEELVPSHRRLAEEASASLLRADKSARLPIVQLYGSDDGGKRGIARAVSAAAGLCLHVINARVIPTEPRELEALIRLWEREAALSMSAILIDCGDIDSHDAARDMAVARFAEGAHCAVMVSCRAMRHFASREQIVVEVHKPTSREQLDIWGGALGRSAVDLNGRLEMLAAQFDLDTSTIRSICRHVLGRMPERRENGGEAGADISHILWDACMERVRPRLEDLVQRIKPIASWDDLVLPEAQIAILREIAVHVRQRMRVYEEWGFAKKSSRGLGISALFTGLSGTGKTMAAEVLANELRMDLYRIDLSQVVSKYIGETEKNLSRIFDSAEAGGAILLFDEADSLFGKRSEVKDSHDRYANIEISYLLQRMETYRGLAILTTNMKSALDTAFLRRIRFVVQFPFPNAAHRFEIWRRIFPESTPADGLDYRKLASLNIAGGNIRNIAMYAAFLAAEACEPVRMTHLLRAARVEYDKMEKSITEAEIRDWV